MKAVFVTGGTGYMGRAPCRQVAALAEAAESGGEGVKFRGVADIRRRAGGS